jgi:RNA polymerase sigma-32 factor
MVLKNHSRSRNLAMKPATLLAVGRDNNLSHYLQEIRKFPFLSLEEELSLARRWRDGSGP